jgi:transglutaminase-like putative cysteine protease
LCFEQPIREHHCELRLVPRDDTYQRLIRSQLSVEPEGGVHEYVDYFGNRISHVDILMPHPQLTTHLRAEVETLLENPFDFPLLTPPSERNWLRDSLQREPQLWDYVLHRSPLTPDVARLPSGDLDWPPYDAELHLIDAVIAAREWVTTTFAHDPEALQPRPIAELLAIRTGNAQDLAHLLVTAVRRWGFPARYVTGYREPEEDDAAEKVGAEKEEAAAHAWTEVLIPGAGWRGFDPTAALVVNASYIAVGVGRDANDVPLLRNSFKGTGDDVTPLTILRLQRQEGAAQQ